MNIQNAELEDFDMEPVPIDTIKSVHDFYMQGGFPPLEEIEVHPELELGSVENYLYFTLPTCISARRSSGKLWQSALLTFQDSETNFVFSPAEVVSRPFEDTKAALLKYKLAQQHNKHPEIWRTICHTLDEHYDGDPRQILAEGDFEIRKVCEILQKIKKTLFPHLGGLKLSNFWLFTLKRYADVEFSDPYALSIIPDTHVIKATKRLGLVPGDATPEDVDQVWRTILPKLKILPEELSPALWSWSRAAFQLGNVPRVHRQLPLF